MIDEYFRHFETLIATTEIVHSSTVTYDKRSSTVGFIRGNIYFLDGSCLHVREFVNVQHGIDRFMYVFQYQNPTGALMFRYDNTPHFPGLPTFPHHKHDGSEVNVVATHSPRLETVLAEIRRFLTEAEL